ncbi:MAG: hypothetical protein A2X08_02805 [Bacteroidetes bacterium GWA2_32_17]|nr:MAG: hypothetical protein A2X08_02805 [Bacteroidetes bacterium GWA2_32_17]
MKKPEINRTMNNEIKMSELFPKLRDYKIKGMLGWQMMMLCFEQGIPACAGMTAYGRIYGCGTRT